MNAKQTQPPAAEWGERPREKVTVMPGRRGNAARGAKSDTLCAVPVGFAIPEAEMRGAAHGHLGRAFFVCGAFAGAETNSTCGFIPVTDGQTALITNATHR